MNFKLWLDGLNEEELNEIFDKRVPYKDKSSKLVGVWDFDVDDKTYEVIAFNEGDESYKVAFYYKEGTERIASETNFGKASLVMGMVMDIVEKEVIRKHTPSELSFETTLGKKSEIYDKILIRYFSKIMGKYGYKLQTGRHEVLPMKIYKYIKENRHL